MKKKIVAIVGSLRRNSFNRQLALEVQKQIGGRAEFEILEYADVPLFNEDIEFPAPESVRRIRETVKTADGVWIFTPEYNYSYPGVLKNVLDWLSRPLGPEEPQVLAGKAAVISGAAYGMAGTVTAQEHLIPMLVFLRLRLMNVPRLTVGSIGEQLDQNGMIRLSETSGQYLRAQVDAFLDFLEA